MDGLNKELRDQAIHLGLCADWKKLWCKDWSQKKMADMMFRGLDFCLKHHYPSNDFLAKHFDKEFLRSSNVFVNDHYSINNPEESLVLGNSEITFRYNANCYGNIHVRDNSSANLIARNRSFVIAHLYENASIKAQQLDNSKIVLVKHSEKVSIIADPSIKIREEYDYLK